MGGVWTIFPHVSIAAFNAGGRLVMLSQLLPGERVDESVTWQLVLVEEPLDKDQATKAQAMVDLLRTVVEEEDYLTGKALQRGLKAGALDAVTFGRNEGGPQMFHAWVERVVATEDNDLDGLFASPDQPGVAPDRRVA